MSDCFVGDTLCLSELNLSTLNSQWLLPLFEDSVVHSSRSSSRRSSLSHVAKELIKKRGSKEVRLTPEELEKLSNLHRLRESDADTSGDESDSGYRARISKLNLPNVSNRPPSRSSQNYPLSPLLQSPASSSNQSYSVTGPMVDPEEDTHRESSHSSFSSFEHDSGDESIDDVLASGGDDPNMSVIGAQLPLREHLVPGQPSDDEYKTFLPPSPDLLKKYYDTTSQSSVQDVTPTRGNTTPFASRRTSFADVHSAIRVLDLSSNQLQSLDTLRNIRKLRQLKEMDLGHNNIDSLTKELFEVIYVMMVTCTPYPLYFYCMYMYNSSCVCHVFIMCS